MNYRTFSELGECHDIILMTSVFSVYMYFQESQKSCSHQEYFKETLI